MRLPKFIVTKFFGIVLMMQMTGMLGCHGSPLSFAQDHENTFDFITDIVEEMLKWKKTIFTPEKNYQKLLDAAFDSDKVTEGKKIVKKKVCIIGAGPSGLSMTRHLSELTDKFDIAVFEQNSDIGGTWIYTDETDTNKYGYPVHSSMYRDLWTNLPKEVLTFPDYPEIKSDESCVPRAVVEEYLKNYTDNFNLRKFVQFNTRVLKVKLDESESSVDKWKVQVKKLEANNIEEDICDFVVVCNGHLFDPKIPKIPGIENFKGMNIHSHSYRNPETFSNRKVVVLGAGSSGVDIALELVKTADEVYLSHRNPRSILKGENLGITEIKGVERFENGEFVLQDNSTLEVDAIIFCTGYKTEFPFLDDNAGITVDDNFVSPLYKHIFNVEHPSMTFVGLPTRSLAYSMFHTQSQYVTSVLKGKVRLPSKEVMAEDAKLKTLKKRDAHALPDQWAYNDELSRIGGFDKIPQLYRRGYKVWDAHRTNRPGDFKNFRLVIESDNKTVYVVPK